MPLEVRAAGQSITVAVNMAMTFAVAQAFLPLLCRLKFVLFFFFAGWVVAMTAFVALFVPETKGVPIEDMAAVWSSHWYWKRFVVHGHGRRGDIEMGHK
uniref:Major facilitator superfamily (MFS) profile domain-containing protein n=1 Tax=Oryza punctata TaxID=4537 RepID=A0A0E0LZG6_ORYPU